MALLDDILAWTISDLSLWQRDAERRLFQKEAGLSVQDYDELYVLLRAAHGLPNPLNLQPVPLAAEHLPAKLASVATVVLKAMRDLRHVNRIAQGQTLPFSPTGITVIYGGNGTGKSGYSRVLKHACRARDQAEPIHADATDPNAQASTPKATFDIEIGGIAKSVNWSRGGVPPDELSTIAVFDCHCARAYLSEGEAAYRPYGLDVVENLANKVLPELSRKLDQEIAGVNVDVEPFKHLLGETVVGKLIVTIGDKTDPAKVKELATLNKEQSERILELDKALMETNPKAKAKDLRLSAERLKGLAARVGSALAWVGQRAVERLKDLDESSATAIQAEKIAAEQFRSGGELLPGTGDLVWKALFDAARKYSLEVAYPEHEFPHVDVGARCLLCQQPVNNVAERLKRFEQFVKEDAAKVAAERRKQVEAAKKKIEAANVSVGLDKGLADELDSLDETLAQTTRDFEIAIALRRGWMLEAVKSHSLANIPALAENPRRRLRDLAARQFKTARTLEKAADEAKSKALKIERDELRARQNLGTSMNAVLALIERMKLNSALESCKKDLKTRPISDKAKEFASNATTAALKTALDGEFKVLGIGHIGTKLKGRIDKGKMKYQLLLDLPVSNRLEEILSEGEQRAIAIGSFLAELHLANHSGGIVFDDPVSSLDHWRRRHVARRFVEEAKQRQVVVLTHDTAFLGELRDAIDQLGVVNAMHNLECRNDRPGHVSEGLPWEHQGYKERIDTLEKAQKVFEKKPWPAYPSKAESAEMRQQYDQFRATVERVIQDVVFNGVVKRYRDWIRVDSLGDVVGFEDAEHKAIAQLHKRCCDVVDAHDPSSAKNAAVPTALELGQDLSDLQAVIKSIQDRRKNAKAAKSGP